LVSQAEIHDMAFSEDVDQRKRAAKLFKKFGRLEDKETAWKDLHSIAVSTFNINRLATKMDPFFPKSFIIRSRIPDTHVEVKILLLN